MEPEAWILPSYQSMSELEESDRAIAAENESHYARTLDLFTAGGELWMRMWPFWAGIEITHAVPRMVLLHLAKAFRDLRCARKLLVSGYGAEAALMWRRSDES